MASGPAITLYTGQTPNGVKISITLEELGLPYKVYKVDVKNNEQKQPWFLEINPNGRIPAITDIDPDGREVRVFESGSIMQYLVDRYDVEHKISYPRGSRQWIEMNSWLFFQNAGIGPMQGQANIFFRYCSEHVPYAIERYQSEVRRLYDVLDKHLRDNESPFLVGDKCTIADIAHWGWVTLAKWALGGEGDALEAWPALRMWEEIMFQRAAVQRGRQVPKDDMPHQRELLRDSEAMRAFEEKGREFYKKQAAKRSNEE